MLGFQTFGVFAFLLCCVFLLHPSPLRGGRSALMRFVWHPESGIFMYIKLIEDCTTFYSLEL